MRDHSSVGLLRGVVPRARSLTSLLLERARDEPDHRALVLVEEDGSERTVTVRELHDGAIRMAGALRDTGAAPGDLVMLLVPHGLDVFVLFWAALYAGCVVCIYAPPSPRMDLQSYGEQVGAAARHAEARLLLTTADWARSLHKGEAPCAVLELGEVRRLARADRAVVPVPRQEADPAVMFHTSGSSGRPKPVRFNDRQLLDHSIALAGAVDARPDDVVVSWLPLHHDMGLHAALMLPMLARIPLVIMSPEFWIRRPAHLLRAVHDHKGTLTWMPNFAFNHTVRRVLDREINGLDLSSWRLLINSAEPVSADSLAQFLARFGERGLRPSALATGYGMTEVGGISISPPGARVRVDRVDGRVLRRHGRARPVGQDEPGGTAVVSCGVPMPTLEVRVLGDQDAPLGEREVGEIGVRSPFLFTGYHRRPDLSEGPLREGWFPTGDLGYLAAGQLYVCGRKKDLLIVGGENVFPQDVEAIASGVEGVKPGRVAAFGLFDEALGTEGVVVVWEAAERGVGELDVERELRRRITGELGITLAAVRKVEPGWIRKTPAGKVARASNREGYLEALSQDRRGAE